MVQNLNSPAPNSHFRPTSWRLEMCRRTGCQPLPPCHVHVHPAGQFWPLHAQSHNIKCSPITLKILACLSMSANKGPSPLGGAMEAMIATAQGRSIQLHAAGLTKVTNHRTNLGAAGTLGPQPPPRSPFPWPELPNPLIPTSTTSTPGSLPHWQHFRTPTLARNAQHGAPISKPRC